jgi:hydrogenase maturation protease
MPRTLVIGYGNLEREDDGVAFHVVNRLRTRLDQPRLVEDEEGIETLDQTTAVFVPQLVPELAVDVAGYENIVLVDAHATEECRPVVCVALHPEFQAPAFSHLLQPGMFVWWVQVVSGRNHAAFLVSVRGHSFEHRRSLSPDTAALIDPAVDKIWELMGASFDAPEM